MPTLRSTLRLLVLLTALMNYAVAASAHDHAGSAPPADGLCAICVYVGGSLGGTPAPHITALSPCWHVPPEGPHKQSFFPPFLASFPIRGPPIAA